MKKKLKLLFIFVIFISCLLCPSPAQAVQTNKDFLPSSWWNAACPANAIAAQGAAIGKPAVNSIDWRNQTINAKEGDLVDLQLVILGIACSRWNATQSRPDFTWDLIQSITGNNGSSTYDFYGNNIQGNTALSIVQPHGYYYTAAQDQIDAVPVNFKLKIPFVASAGLYQYDVTGSPLKKINYIPGTQTYNGTILYQCVQSGGNVYGITGTPTISKFDPCATGIIDVPVVQINVAKQLGTLKIDKTENGTAPSSVDVKKANVKMKNRSTIDNGSTWSDIYADSAEWVNYTKNDVWVSNSSYNSTIAVPNNFKLGSVKKNGVAMTTTCSENTNKTGTCDITGVDITNGGTTSLVIDYIALAERKGSLDDICNNSFSTQTDQWFADRNTTRSINATSAWGYVYDSFLAQSATDSTTTPSNARIVFDEGLSGQQTKVVLANKERPNLTTLYQLKSPYHSFNADLPLNLFDGAQHTAKLYIEYGSGPSLASIGSKTFTCEKWFYPWLRTSQGDVVADGKISGQLTSNGGTSFAGARLDNANAKEAEFLVISAVDGGGPFCSTYKYILTNTSSQGTDCGNGAGYNFNSTGIDNVIDSVPVDRVIGGVKQAFADNGNNANSAPSACSANGIATATQSGIPLSLSTTCPGGLILVIPAQATNTSSTTVNGGRVTIYVQGDLTINKNFNTSNSSSDPRLAPSLAIVVDGNINIASTVSSIYAQLYSAKKINTCTTSTGTPATPQECSANRLLVNGSLSAKAGFEFKRTFVDTAYQNSAEQIKLTGNSIVIPSPGIDSRYFYNNFSSYKLDSAEYNPRF